MLDPAIQDFLNERKEGWLKKKIKNNTNDEDKAQFHRQAMEEFSLAGWLPSAVKRARQLFIVSHPGKYSHPSAKISSIIAPAHRQIDGFLRTGNTDADLDVFGNAAAMDVYKFLTLTLSDGESILSHLEKKSALIKKQLSLPNLAFDEIETGLLAIKEDGDTTVRTSGKVKQVYFPVDDESYHLLSILTPSNLLFKLKERIKAMNDARFTDEGKTARAAKKQQLFYPNPFSEVYDLSIIGFGGTKPQNISVMNSQNYGEAYLLKSTPPDLKPRSIRPPKTNFFTNTLWAKAYQDDFQQLQKLLSGSDNNVHIRKKRDWVTRNIIYQIVDRLWMIRRMDKGWSDSDTYQSLPSYQKIWLDQQYKQNREENTDWLEAVKTDLARWFLNSSQTLIKDKKIELGDEHISYFIAIINECEEALR